jgi:hypothetical protein
MSPPAIPDLALPSSRAWLILNAFGAAVFLWQYYDLWARRDEGYTFLDGAPPFSLLVIFGAANVVMLLLKTVVSVQLRNWGLIGVPTFTLVIWGALTASLLLHA